MAYNERGVTFIELIFVLVIIGILASLALPNYRNIKEQALDKEAKVNLKLIQAAEKIYRMEVGFYYHSIVCPDNAGINTNLRLSLPTGSSRSWSYQTQTAIERADALRTRGEVISGRYWSLDITAEEPICTSATGDPCL